MQFLRCEKCNELKYLYKEFYDFIKLCFLCLSKSERNTQEKVFNKFKDDQNLLGEFYYFGIFVEKEKKEAFKWFRRAAEQGNAGAQYNLGICYDNGEGVEQDYKEAAKWYRRAAEQGDANAQLNLGVCYRDGQGVEKNDKEEAKWYRRAAEQGQADAQCNLGACYYHGIGVEKDYKVAVKWLTRAAEQGQADAHFNLGVRYYNGEGVEQDHKEAAKWIRRAAEQGHVDAQENFDYLINESEHREELCRIFGISYELTNPSDYHIAVCLYKGILGYKKDKIMAIKYFEVLSHKGDEKAKLFLKVYEELEVFPKELRDIIIEYYLE